MSSPTFLWKGLGTSTTLLVSQPRNLTAAAKSLQSCLTLCDPIDSSPPASPIPGILHARTLEWVAISFCNAWKWKVKVKSLSCVWLLATPWTTAHQAPLSMGFSRQEYWSGVPSPSPRCLIFYLAALYHFSFILQIFIKKLPCVRHYVRCWESQPSFRLHSLWYVCFTYIHTHTLFIYSFL